MVIQEGNTCVSVSGSEDDGVHWTDNSSSGVSLIDSANELMISNGLQEDGRMETTSPYQQHQLVTIVYEDDEEEDLEQRAPFIPMGDEDDLPILDPTEILIEMDQFDLSPNRHSKS